MAGTYLVLTSGVLENIQFGNAQPVNGGNVDTVVTGGGEGTIPPEEEEEEEDNSGGKGDGGGNSGGGSGGGSSGGGSSGGNTTAVWKCVSYPKCNTGGTDARKKCCCTEKCKAMGRTFKSINYQKGECYCNDKPSTFEAGSSGNCNWDTKGGWCWTSTACGGKCKACITGYKTTNTKSGCDKVRSYFLNNSSKCPACVYGCGCKTNPKCNTVGGKSSCLTCCAASSKAAYRSNEAIKIYKYSDNHNIPYAYMIKRQKAVADMTIAI